MKKTRIIVFWLLLFISSISCIEYTLELYDDNEDGWESSSLMVYVDHIPISTHFFLEDGYGPEILTLQVDYGSLIAAYYTGGGSDYLQHWYMLKNNYGEVVIRNGYNSQYPGDFSYTVPAEGSPYPAQLLLPQDGAERISINSELTWTEGSSTVSCDLYLSENEDLSNPTIISSVTSPYSPTLEYDKLYYWKIRSTGTNTSQVESQIWSFTTQFQPVTSFPYVESFETWPPQDWELDPESGTGSWESDNCVSFGPGNPLDGTAAAMFNNFNYNYGSLGSMISPPFDTSGLNQPRLRFSWWNNDPATDPAILNVYTKSLTGSWELQRNIETHSSGQTSWVEEIILIPIQHAYVKFEAISDYGYKNTFIDKFIIEENPTGPQISIAGEEVNFGNVPIALTETRTVRVSNIGISSALIIDLSIIGEFSYQATQAPFDLETGSSFDIEFSFSPQIENLYVGFFNIVYVDPNNPQTPLYYNIDLLGNGQIPPQGSLFLDPIPLTFPAVDITENTAAYYDIYEPDWINPPNNFIGGNEVVYQVDIENSALINGTITTGNQTLGVFILGEEPNPDNPPEPMAYASSSSSSGGVDIEFSNYLLRSGTSYFVISSHTLDPEITYTMNLTAQDLSLPEVVSNPSPAHNTNNVNINGELSWSKSINAEGYLVYLSTDEFFTNIEAVDITDRNYEYTSLDFNTTYFWKVIPYNYLGQVNEGIETWSFTTKEDPTITLPLTIDFEGLTDLPPQIDYTDLSISVNQYGNDGYALTQVMPQQNYVDQILFQPVINITPQSVISFDYNFLSYSTSAPWYGLSFIQDFDYLTIKVSTDYGANFTTLDQINRSNHTTTSEYTNYSHDIGMYTGQTLVFKFELAWIEMVDIYIFNIDNIFIGSPEITSLPSPTNVSIIKEGMEVEMNWDNVEGALLYHIYWSDQPYGDYEYMISCDSNYYFGFTEIDKMFFKIKASSIYDMP